MKKISRLIVCIIFGFLPMMSLAMDSVNYSIDVDTLSAVGGDASSASFSTLDSGGEPFMGSGASGSYAETEGFGSETDPSISLELDSAVKNLGNITPGSPITGTTTATVITDSLAGYDLAIFQDKNLTHTDATTEIASYACDIATPCIWSGYGTGFTVKSGTGIEAKWFVNPDYFYAAIPTVATIFHTKNGFSSGGDSTGIEYKVNVPVTQRSGEYANAITYVAITKI